MIKSKDVMADLQAFVRREVSNPKRADACANALLDCFRLNFKSQYIYVPTQFKRNLEKEKRDKSIVAGFTGNNHNELAIQFRLSLQAVYKILKAASRRSESGEKPLKPVLLFVLDEYLPDDLARAGLKESEAQALSYKVAEYVCDQYPGVMFRMTETTRTSAGGVDRDA